jgi:hypothetical protein
MQEFRCESDAKGALEERLRTGYRANPLLGVESFVPRSLALDE